MASDKPASGQPPRKISELMIWETRWYNQAIQTTGVKPVEIVIRTNAEDAKISQKASVGFPDQVATRLKNNYETFWDIFRDMKAKRDAGGASTPNVNEQRDYTRLQVLVFQYIEKHFTMLLLFYKTVEYNQKRFETLKAQDKHPEVFRVPPEFPSASFQYPSDEIIEIWKCQELRARSEFNRFYFQRQRILQELRDADPGFLTYHLIEGTSRAPQLHIPNMAEGRNFRKRLREAAIKAYGSDNNLEPGMLWWSRYKGYSSKIHCFFDFNMDHKDVSDVVDNGSIGRLPKDIVRSLS
jgi:hypothetical protein